MDVFISYRRDGGESWAPLIKEELRKRGVFAYLDKHNMKNGNFDDSLKTNIRNAPNFLLILSKGIFQKREGTDWVREEIKYATEIKRNIICVMVNGYDISIDLSDEHEAIKAISTYDILTYNDSNPKYLKASIDSIIGRMVNDNGKPWKKEAVSGSWYSSHSLTDADKLWMYTNYEVSRRLDKDVLKHIMDEDIFKTRKTINYMCLTLYDVDSIKQRTSRELAKNSGYEINVYGFAHEYEREEVEEAFGVGHFLFDNSDDERINSIQTVLGNNHLKYFDIIECTLALKDIKKPEQAIKDLVNYLNPEGGIIYFRELDDDYVDAYPDPNGYIKSLVDLLALDPGAGNRHLGKKMYTNLIRAGSDKIYISNQVVSTANVNFKTRRKILDAYFSYLVPEFESLVEEHPENDEYKAALDYLNKYYDEIIELFSSKDFYCRVGFIAGYGLFIEDDYDDEDD